MKNSEIQKKPTGLLPNGTSLVLKTDEEGRRKAVLIAEFLNKFAVVEGRPVSEAQIAVYCEALGEYDIRKLEKGLRRYLAKGTRWPWPGTLSEWIEEEV